MLEKEVEGYLCRRVKADLGGRALKFVSPGLAGVPDRLVLLPGGRALFVELKAPGKKLRVLQAHVRGMLAGLGFDVRAIDTKDGVDALIRELEGML